MKISLPKGIIKLLADISNKECEATATEIEEDADLQIYAKCVNSCYSHTWNGMLKNCSKVQILTKFYIGMVKGDWYSYSVREKLK